MWRLIMSGGYIYLDKPVWYTGAPNSSKCTEHVVVWCAINNLNSVPQGYCVHHIDHNKTNNNPENLMLISGSQHTKYHNKYKEPNKKAAMSYTL